MAGRSATNSGSATHSGSAACDDGPKAVYVERVIFDRNDDQRIVVSDITFESQKDLREILRIIESPGLVLKEEYDLMDKGGKETKVKLITAISELQAGKTYRAADNYTSTKAMRQQLTNLGQAHELELQEAVLRHGLLEDPTSAPQPEWRVLTNVTGVHEMEVDAVIAGDKMAYLVSHKTTYEGVRMFKEIATKASMIKHKSVQEEYAGTAYEHFKGKELVPVFMAENTAKLDAAARSVCRSQGVRLYRRNGTAIGPWASLKRPEGATMSASTMRWVL
ncbi:hypothetical protein HYH02_002875 [Chlamydomonas schloesseri]|uniref:Uncharacterized protein n=1 Tax=Chlamydomonas schloesseri TaxID=2026947 RepID=A0A835WSI0_9CHLO|nr:hypothetical protein HYH02_002875 [Chlamydomonas schloesseri]|eukprot:KAG2452642.1 hypothetical protein HYH02_002875 [Chlamydomonas schloesseri]